MVGKYTGLSDAYLSVLKALQHACLAINRKLEVQWIEAGDLEDPGKARSPAPAPPRAAWHAAGHASDRCQASDLCPSSGRARSPRRTRRHGRG